MNKKEAFEYVLFRLTEWYKTINQINNNNSFNSSNDLSKLKIIKLHFFVSAVNSKKNNLLNLFDNFYAMPYGHVESDIYKEINKLNRFTVSTNSLKIKDEYIDTISNSFADLNPATKTEIDEAITILKNENVALINLSALDLVDISHIYFSWKYTFNIARSNDRYSEPIPAQLIKEETKYFALNY
jgi:uncharacterized phage-associated protein